MPDRRQPAITPRKALYTPRSSKGSPACHNTPDQNAFSCRTLESLSRRQSTGRDNLYSHSSGVKTTYLFRIISKIQICPFCFFTLYSKGGKFKLFTQSLFIFSYFQKTTITITQKTEIMSQGVIIHFVPIFPDSRRNQ